MTAAPDRLEVGRIGRPQGLRGEVTALLSTDRAERTEPGAVLYADDRELVVVRARARKQGWVIQFEGVSDVEGAEALRGAVLTAAPLTDDEVEDDTWWVHDLVGADVVDTAGRTLGRVTAIEANPAHDLLVLDGGALVPLPFVTDRAPGRVTIDVPDGLLDGTLDTPGD
jgi:16S rRNA processing protein RimM